MVLGPWMKPGARSLGLMGVLATASCVLFVQPVDVGLVQDFGGATSGTRSDGSGTSSDEWTCKSPRSGGGACAACIYSKCNEAISKCCEHSQSSDCLYTGVYWRPKNELTPCIQGDAPGCAYLQKGSLDGVEGVVRACVIRECQRVCMGDGRLHQSCQLWNAGSYCTCRDAETSQGPECSAAEVGASWCARVVGGCACGKYGCAEVSKGCACSYDGEGVSKSCQPSSVSSSNPQCCLDLSSSRFSCSCTASSCAGTNEYSVPSCDESTVLEVLTKAGLTTDRCSR